MNTNISLTPTENADLYSILCDVLEYIDKAEKLDKDVSRIVCPIYLFDNTEGRLRSILQKLK